MVANRSLRLLAIGIFYFLICGFAFGQTPISNATTNTTSPSTSSYTTTATSDAGGSYTANQTYLVKYGEGVNRLITSYTLDGVADVYNNFVQPDTLIIQRTDNSKPLIVFYEYIDVDTGPNPDEVNLEAEQVQNEDSLYKTGFYNAGYDNILVNNATNFTNAERIDLIFYSGVLTSTPGNAVFPVIERGGNDDIKVAAIKALDASGQPSEYFSNVIQIDNTSGSDEWGDGIEDDGTMSNIQITTTVLRRTSAGADPQPQTTLGGQTVHGSAVSFTEFGIAANEIVYGYSIFSNDVDETDPGVDLTDITTFPTNTGSASGLDLIAGVSTAVANDNNLRRATGPGGYKSALNTWFKANELDTVGTTTSNNGNVEEWEDQWTGDHDALDDGFTAPTFLDGSGSGLEDINFNATVDFVDGADRGLQIPNNTDFNTATSYTTKSINIAFRTGDNVTTKQQIYEQGSNDRGINLYIRNGSLYAGAWNEPDTDGTGDDWTFNSISTSSITTETEYIVTLEFSGNSGKTGTFEAYLNGSSFGSLSSVGLLFADTNGIGLGDINSESRYDDGTTAASSFRGSIPEFIYCNSPGTFSTAVRNKIESYLALKYGITLDQSVAQDYVSADGTTIFDASNSAAIGGFLEYNKDIAGIGRDDDSEFLQPTSQSENSGSIVRVARNSQIGSDNNWLIWGNDAGTLTENSSDVPTGIVNRLNRVWRASEIGEIGVTDVSFDLTSIDNGGSLDLDSEDANMFSLLVAGTGSSGVFSSAQVIEGGTLSTIDGNTFITFSNVNIENLEYFTLGTEPFICGPGGVTANIKLWLKANEGVKNGSSVITSGDLDEWENAAANSNLTELVNNEGNPLLVQNGFNFNPYIEFDGANSEDLTIDDIEFSTLFTDQQHSTFLLLNYQTNTADGVVIGGWENDASPTTIRNAYFEKANSGANLRNDHVQKTNISSNLTFSNDSLIIAAALTDPTNHTLYINGQEDTQTTSNSIGAEEATGDFALGSRPKVSGSNGSSHTDSQMGEVVIYSDDLNATDQRKVESYLAIKYGLTLGQDNNNDGTPNQTLSGSIKEGDYISANGTIIWDREDYLSYYFDVAGIGRDDKSCLQQLQSKSENTGAIVTMGLGEIASDNASNSNSFANDNAFLVWGNDNADATRAGNVSYTEGSITERMLRIWRVEENGNTVGATDISFDLTSLGYTGSLSDYQLIVSDASGLTSPTIYPASAFASDVVSFSSIDLTDGQYFTLGTQRSPCGPGGVETSLVLWLRADSEAFNVDDTDLATDTEDVVQWKDQSPNANNASDTFTGNNDALDPPAFTANGTNFNPHITFSNTDDNYLAIPDDGNTGSGLNPEEQAIFVAGSLNTASDQYAAFVAKTQNYNWQQGYALYENGTDIDYHKDDSNDATTNVPGVAFTSGETSLFLAYSDASNNAIGINLATPTTTGINTRAQTTQPVTIGAVINGGNDGVRQFLEGTIGDIILFDDDLNSTQRQQVATYLAVKYGITLDQTSPTNYIWSNGSTILWNATDNSSYNDEIAGIGRDDASCFVQKQSTSVNDIVTIGLGTIASTNQDNINAFSSDGDYLIWGNDQGSTSSASTNTADTPVEIAERMTRIWRVDETGTVGNTEIQFELGATGFSTTSAEDYRLMIASSGSGGTMASATLVSGGTFNGTVLSFTGINLADGEYFTIGIAERCGPGGVNDSSLALWLRADEEVYSDEGTTLAVDGNDVLQWDDQSGNTRNAEDQSLGGAAPVEPIFQTSEINYNPSLLFSDPNTTNAGFLSTTNGNTVDTDITMITVFNSAQNQGTDNNIESTPSLLSAPDDTNEDYGLGLYQGEIVFNASNNDDFQVRSGSGYNNGETYIATATREQNVGTVLYVNSDNVNTGTADNTTLNNPTTFTIGNHTEVGGGESNLASQFQGEIAESIVFSKVLSTQERVQVESYLALKYGLTRSIADGDVGSGFDSRDYLNSDGTVFMDYSLQTTDAFYNDIAGIGRDDNSCLNQLHSKSENSDAIVDISISSFDANNEFFVWGNDNASMEAINNKERPAGINSRLNREWQAQETGTVGTVSVTFDLLNITGTPTGPNDLNDIRLMRSVNNDFSSGVTLTSPTSINSGSRTVTFDVDFESGTGFFFTLGSIEFDALPIELLSFTANSLENEILLRWSTASESNNSHFVIERSTNSEIFESIGIVQGAGNSSELKNYYFNDPNPYSGDNYYRIRQVDFSGTYDFSEIVSVPFEQVDKLELNIYPNPVGQNEILRLAISGISDRSGTITLYNSQGQLLVEKEINVHTRSFEWQLPSIPKGIYFIELFNGVNKSTTKRLIIR